MKFNQIPGSEKVKSELLKKLNGGNMPHAMLFSGEAGNTKLALALATSQFLVCRQPTQNDSCGECPSCQRAQKFIHPDIHFSFPVVAQKSGDKPVSTDFYAEWRQALEANPYLEYRDWMECISSDNKQGNITREECRNIIGKLSLKAFEGGVKILIMWLPEYLGKEGNALLKIIEEPPLNTFFILVTDKPDAILPTILSRTQLFTIPSLSETELKQYLLEKELAALENAEQLVFMSGGSIGKAKQLMAISEDDYTTAFIDWMRNCYSRNIAATTKWTTQMAGTGRESLKIFLNNALHLLRECLMIRELDNYHTRVPLVHQEFVKKFSRNTDSEVIEDLYTLINEAIYETERNINAKILLFDLSLKIQDIFENAKKRITI